MLSGKQAFARLATPPEAPRKKYEPMPIHPIQTYNNPTIAFAQRVDASPDGRSIAFFGAGS